MKIFFLLILALIPSFVFADVAWPVLTKVQACQESDGESMSRLQIFLNGKKSDTLYFFKQANILYYVVSLFPSPSNDWYPNYNSPSWALFLYQYSCTSHKSKLVTSKNLKKLAKRISYGSSESDNESITPDKIKNLNYGQVTGITATGITLTLGQTQTPWQVYIRLKK